MPPCDDLVQPAALRDSNLSRQEKADRVEEQLEQNRAQAPLLRRLTTRDYASGGDAEAADAEEAALAAELETLRAQQGSGGPAAAEAAAADGSSFAVLKRAVMRIAAGLFSIVLYISRPKDHPMPIGG